MINVKAEVLKYIDDTVDASELTDEDKVKIKAILKAGLNADDESEKRFEHMKELICLNVSRLLDVKTIEKEVKHYIMSFWMVEMSITDPIVAEEYWDKCEKHLLEIVEKREIMKEVIDAAFNKERLLN